MTRSPQACPSPPPTLTSNLNGEKRFFSEPRVFGGQNLTLTVCGSTYFDSTGLHKACHIAKSERLVHRNPHVPTVLSVHFRGTHMKLLEKVKVPIFFFGRKVFLWPAGIAVVAAGGPPAPFPLPHSFFRDVCPRDSASFLHPDAG